MTAGAISSIRDSGTSPSFRAKADQPDFTLLGDESFTMEVDLVECHEARQFAIPTVMRLGSCDLNMAKRPAGESLRSWLAVSH